jgi:hypothetical protein
MPIDTRAQIAMRITETDVEPADDERELFRLRMVGDGERAAPEDVESAEQQTAW